MLQNIIVKELEQIVGEKNLITARIPLATYAYDASQFFGTPDAVVFPTTTEMVSAIFKLAQRYDLEITPRGAGTCLSGGAVASQGGIVISMNKMNRILDINPGARTVLAEAGAINKQVQLLAEPYGLMFAPDPGSLNVATIGGNISENAGGMRGVKYGCTKDHILGLELVLPTGEIVTTGEMVSPSEEQIDLSYFLCGSEGTLGVVTKALLSLTPINSHVVTMTAVFDNLADAGDCVADIIAKGVIPTTMEIMDNTLIRAVEDYAKLGLPVNAEALLLLEVDGFSSEVEVQFTAIIESFKTNKAQNYTIANSELERLSLWKARRSANGALGKLKPSMVVQDIVVPRDRLPIMLSNVSALAQKYGIIIAQVAHAGDGNLHPHLLYDHRISQENEVIESVCDEIFKEALAQGGTLSGEHGIGLEKIKYMPLAFSQESLNYMKRLKTAFDPQAKLNPGKLISEGMGEGFHDPAASC
ncbi:FAD/FMN-dependent dehydrogenase [Desulfosporosinus orientis DSM 765]|uniref:FAD/FMN-dependent dehydrogenase n=1 Tax=Desulfosporosinus orientis (strain ATCC 19365 / DSM 765 / NCIMB 8382 / VKM B-1628 / Singapore I) TaxID=768706 RepID=G7WIY7_DESOD|nr:FAD-linked oxidase C-terminal domain-containing protein [Desulfosporosinus orientis]AET69712.1 FAD/FMN-dependent dehydrogenase [Desulfosporosinus orientis DSM 765]